MRQVTTATPTQGRERIPRWNAGSGGQCVVMVGSVQALIAACHGQRAMESGHCGMHAWVTAECHLKFSTEILFQWVAKAVTRA